MFCIKNLYIFDLNFISIKRPIQNPVHAGCSAHELTIKYEILQEKNNFLMAKKFHKISILAKIFEILPELGYHSDRVETSSTTFLCRILVICAHFLLWVSGCFL